MRKGILTLLLLAIGKLLGDIHFPDGTYRHMGECLRPSLDDLVAAELGGLATLVGAVEHLTVDGLTLIVYLHFLSSCGYHSVTCLDDLILYSVLQDLDILLLGILRKEILTSFLVVTIFEQCLLHLHLSHKGLGFLVSLLHRHQSTLTVGATDETRQEEVCGDTLGGVVAIDFLIDAWQHLFSYLLTDLRTYIKRCLVVVATVGKRLT